MNCENLLDVARIKCFHAKALSNLVGIQLIKHILPYAQLDETSNGKDDELKESFT
ncbi:hypothetical protein Syun_012140 [Stephania yunnanensis]|uniref:Uncharacterized protein n=1 Tax=Stephania yunnanensis TaxID=152371 RepID=A0AAP0K163_9MAGN